MSSRRVRRLEVVLTTSDEVLQLRRQIERQRAELAELRTQYNRTEYLYRCEVLINLQVSDYCREHGFRIPRSIAGKAEQPTA